VCIIGGENEIPNQRGRFFLNQHADSSEENLFSAMDENAHHGTAEYSPF
jgi:hypothetical protein